MTSWGVDLVALVAAAIVVWGRADVALSVLLGVAVLVPTPLVVPHMHTALFTLQRLLVIVVVARLLRMAADRRPSMRRPYDPATFALSAVILVSFGVGIVASVSSAYNEEAGLSLASVVAQLGFFLACLALVRELDSPWQALVIATCVMFLDVGIAIGEHFSGGSWGHWWLHGLRGQSNLDASHPLALRNGETRVKAGSEFALQFAWVTVSLLPCALAVASRIKAGLWLGIVAVATAGAAVYWSYSRSALGALVPVVVLVALLVRRSHVLAWLGIGAIAGGFVAYELVPSLTRHLSANSEDVSVATRLHKLEPIFGEVARHPFRGLGLGNLSGSGFHTTDNALLLVYIELGVIGVIALVLLFLTVVGQTLRAYAVTHDDDRVIAAACFVGVLAYIVSTQIYDAFTLLQGPQVMWFLVAVATVVAERSGRKVALRGVSLAPAMATAVAGAAIGGVLLAFAPTHVGYRALVVAAPGYRDALPYNTSLGDKYLLTTACTEADRAMAQRSDIAEDCRAATKSTSVGVLYLQAPDKTTLLNTKDALVTTISGVGGIGSLKLLDIEQPHTGRPTALRTGPVWIPLLALGLLVFPPVPPIRRRLRRRTRLVEAPLAG